MRALIDFKCEKGREVGKRSSNPFFPSPSKRDIGSPASAFEKGGWERRARLISFLRGMRERLFLWWLFGTAAGEKRGGGHKMEEELLVCSGKRKNI